VREVLSAERLCRETTDAGGAARVVAVGAAHGMEWRAILDPGVRLTLADRREGTERRDAEGPQGLPWPGSLRTLLGHRRDPVRAGLRQRRARPGLP